MKYDVAIVGAGPAGSTAAYHLARRGHKVVLLDKKSFPRDKVCGDGLIPDSIGCLSRMGLLSKIESEGRQLNKVLVFSPSRIQFEIEGRFITLKRYVLDNLIVEHAVSAGAELMEAGVSDVTSLPVGASLRMDRGGVVNAKVCLLATGARTELSQKLGLVEQSKPDAMAIRCYVRSDLAIDRLVFSFDHSILPGYAWIFPLRNQEFNIGYGIFAGNRFITGGGNLRKSFHTFMERFPMALELLKSGEIISPVKGAMLRCGLTGTKPKLGNILAIGETIGTTFPFSGEGIGKAMETGEIAADVVDKFLRTNDPIILDSYKDRLDILMPKYLGYKMAEKWITKPWVGDLVARRVKKSKFLRASLSGIVNETVDPRQVFSFAGLIRSMFV